MKATIIHNGKTVEVLLTPEQEAEVKRQAFNYQDIKTVEDAFDFLGVNYEEWLELNMGLDDHVKAYIQLTYVAKALNGGEWMNYEDIDEYKYYPYFNASGSAPGFSCLDCGCVRSHSRVGSRLTFKTREMAEYAGKQFLNLYNQCIN